MHDPNHFSDAGFNYFPHFFIEFSPSVIFLLWQISALSKLGHVAAHHLFLPV
jgi:hypothetical protein